MTRVLSELLGAHDVHFQQNLRALETLAGHPQADIRLSDEIHKTLQQKITALHLDGRDTTGHELYAALGQRLTEDEKRFTASLLKSSAGKTENSVETMTLLAREIQGNVSQRSSFSLKSTAAKRILRANLPRKTMKTLGYRSADSMFKHESAACLYAAAWLIESPVWAKKIITSYAKLRASDFEEKDITLEHPSSKRWQQIGESVVAERKNHVLSFKELGTVVLLPLPATQPAFPHLTAAVLALQAINDIRACGTYMKLHQMDSNFGNVLQNVIMGEPMLPSDALDEPMSWHSLHQYFERYGSNIRADIFEPLVSIEEMAWTSVEHVLSAIEPSMEFWHHTPHIAMLAGGHPVSLNLTDSLLSHCNALGYDSRVCSYFRKSLRSELLLRYLSHDKLERTVLASVQQRLVPEMAEI